MKRSLAFIGVLICFLFAHSVSAQGTIKGKVINSETGEELIGANVVITGTTIGSTTNITGDYAINNVEAGVYSVTISFISFDSKTIEGVEVKNNTDTELNVQLTETQYNIKGVNVKGKAIRDTENAMLAIQKKSAPILDGISSQEISLYGDKDAASSLKRVTGIVIIDDKYINIRGLSDRYLKTELNGAEIPSLDPNKNSPQLDLFPSNIIDNILIYKSFSPELPGDFTGGYVNIITKDFPESFTFQFTTGIGFNPQANLNSNFLTYDGGKLDWLGIDDGTRDIPVLAQGDIPYRYEDDARLDAITSSFNKTMEPTRKTSFLNHSHSISVGNQVELFGRALGFVASLSYDRKFSYYDDGEVGHYTLRTNNAPYLQKDLLLDDERGKMKVLVGAIFNMSYRLNDNNTIGLNVIRNQSGIDGTRYQEGYSNYHQVDFQTRTLRFYERSYTTLQLRGDHTLPEARNLNVKWTTSYVVSKHQEPDTRFFTNIYETADDGSKVYFIDIAKQDVPSRYFRDLTEKAINGKLDLTLPFDHLQPSFTLKAGGSLVIKERSFDERIFQYRDNNDSYYGSVTGYIADTNVGTRVYNYPEFFGVFISDGTQLSNIYDGNQTVAAGYFMGDIEITPELRLVAGLRPEYTNISVESKNPNNPKGNLDILHVLPGANLTYNIMDNMNMRGSFSRTLARPTFRELAPYSSFEFSGDFIFTGNPNLKTTTINNYDLRWEWFPKSGEVYSVSYFYKVFNNPIERTFIPEAGNDEITFENVGTAKAHGIEFDIRKSLDFINAIRNIRVGVNFAFIHTTVAIDDAELQAIHATNPSHGSTREMYGQAPFICNASLGYSNKDKGISTNLNYNISGKKLTIVVKGGTPNIFEQARNQLNFNFKKTFGRWGLKFAAKNLLNDSYRQIYTYKGVEYVYSEYTLGREYSIGFSYLIK
jgi:outer membrane receptor protein involved in Fe transport